MKLLIDSDAFCKLGIAGLLQEALSVLNADLSSCGRLPALPHMLRRGRLLRHYGEAACCTLIPAANSIQAMPAAEANWLDHLVDAPNIDPGEAQLFALAAQQGLLVMTGDKRALLALREHPIFVTALDQRIVTLEAILLALCHRLGDEWVRQRVAPLLRTDKSFLVCFSPGNPSPREALLSYNRDLSEKLQPFLLWNPISG